tara:strand:- start:382 stop:543 length:162 start_codon:yes stop_codon:yes gene_type:complete
MLKKIFIKKDIIFIPNNNNNNNIKINYNIINDKNNDKIKSIKKYYEDIGCVYN